MSIPIYWGTQMMGKVDVVPGVGHVATKFFYLQFIPLIPLESHLVFRESGHQYHSVQIPFSPKSIFIAWLRTGCVIAAIALTITGIITLSERHKMQGVISFVCAGLAIGAFIYSYYFGPICRAGYNRAMDLARRANIGAEQLLVLEITYGRMSAEQAELELARIYAEAQKAHEKRLAESPPPAPQPPTEPPYSPDQFVFK